MSQQDTDKLNLGDLGDEDPITKAIREQSMAAQMGGGAGGAGAPVNMAIKDGGWSGLGTPPPSASPAVEPPKIEDGAPLGGGPMSPEAGGAPDYTKLGKFSGRMGNWSVDPTNMAKDSKFNKPWDQLSERYKMLTIMSNFDPNAGVTPEMLDALNKAGGGIKGATFSGSKDKLDARGLNQWENYDGREGIGDIIQGFNDPNNKNKQWGPWSPEGEAPGAPGAMAPGHGVAAGGGPLGIGALNPALTSRDFFQKLLENAKQQAGPEATNDKALLSLMG